uniref:MULE transposase domain-containing protein n=1 Tax=Plectus sambesii TaxID=2011161 RepID=A0A914UKH2_9BILA
MWKADGTFKSAPKGHTQLYTIHARHTRGETIPALYAVMVRKTKSNYRKLFRWLNAELEDEDGSIGALQTVLIDFEPAAKGAFDIEFFSSARNIAVKGCRFHYGQAVSRNFDKKGLKPLKDNDEVFKWRKEILGLALLPPKYVRFIWNTSLRYPPKIRGFSKQFQNFVKYFENQWLSSEEHILHWNHFDNSLCRTTNSAEGWHAGLKATWSGMKPILTTFIEWLKKKNEEHVTRMVQLDDDSFAIKRRDAAYIRLDAQILAAEEHVTRMVQLDDDSFAIKRRDAAYIRLDAQILAAKQRFTALESIENQHYEPDMIPIILRHLRHVSSLCGNVRSKKNAIAPVPIDPSSISLLDPIEPLTTIDLAIASVIRAATNRCRAVVHTYLPPCTCQRSITQQMPPDDDLLDISDDLALEQEETEDSEAAEPESVESLLEFGPCKECQENTADLCSACKLHMHFECGAYRDESIISLCDDCCNEIADVNHIYGRMARRKELEARLQRVYDENFVSDPNCLFYH